MVIFKTKASTLNQVLFHSKHAFHNKLKLSEGELILIQQTYKTLEPNEKSIRWVMNYASTYFDQAKESDKIWGSHWNYIIEGTNLRSIEPFNIEDIQVSNKDYKSAVTHVWVDKSDEVAILNWLDENEAESFETSDLAAEFDRKGKKDINAYIDYLDGIYSGTPLYKTVITRYIQRPSPLRNALIDRDGTKCRICNKEGFIKKNGRRYCEVHHMIELNRLAPNTLQSWNVIIVCPTCHKQLHHGKVITEFLDPGWNIVIENRTYTLR
jgi:5-methylcytosine-specific restriction enzyme A